MSNNTGPTLSPLQQAAAVIDRLERKVAEMQSAAREPIAVLSFGCRFPGGASDAASLWRILRDGIDATTTVPRDRWNADALFDDNPDAPGKICTRRGGFISGVDLFDAGFFGISPREAARIDPQQRLLLEVAWEALESAALAGELLPRKQCGVFVGIPFSEYCAMQVETADLRGVDSYVATGSGSAFAAGRISHALGLQGPALALDTACSSALVAVHLACQSLRARECEVALAGATNLILSPVVSAVLTKAHALSPDGRCKAFDAGANGYGRAEGCGVVVLKRLSQALADRDPILAVIRASAVNHDGRSSGLTVPNGLAQESLLRSALGAAGLSSFAVDFIEAHGTGTPLGDPIEVEALGKVFGADRPADRPLWIGSVKTNLGHLEAASGIAGLFKAILALQHGELPKSLHFHSPNPRIDWLGSGVRVASDTVPLAPLGRPHVAGVSAFGMSGTNAHLLVEAPPAVQPKTAEDDRSSHLLALSARSAPALRELAQRFARHLRVTGDAPADVSYSANVGRRHFEYRMTVIGSTCVDLAARIDDWLRTTREEEMRPVRASSEETHARAPSDGARPLDELAQRYQQGASLGFSALGRGTAQRRVALPSYPFQRQRFWMDAGLARGEAPTREPSHSGCLSPLTLSARAQPYLQDHQVHGEVVVPAAFHLARTFAAIPDGGELRDVRFPHAIVLRGELGYRLVLEPGEMSGSTFRSSSSEDGSDYTDHATGVLQRITTFAANCDLESIRARCTHVLDPGDIYQRIARCGVTLGPEFRGLREIRRNGRELLARIELPAGAAPEPSGLHTVEIDSSFQSLAAFGSLEETTTPWVPVAVDRIRLAAATAGARLWCHAVAREDTSPDLRRADISLCDDKGHVIAAFTGVALRPAERGRFLGKVTSRNEWLYLPEWTLDKEEAVASARLDGRWLVIGGTAALAAEVVGQLSARGGSAVSAPGSQAVESIERAAELRGVILAMDPVGERAPLQVAVGVLRALARRGVGDSFQLCLATRGAQHVAVARRPIDPLQAQLWGLVRTAAFELPGARVTMIDLDVASASAPQGEAVQIAAALSHSARGSAVREGRRYLPGLARAHSSSGRSDGARIRSDATYLITGGMGGIGLEIASELVAQGARRLLLLGRRAASPAAAHAIEELRGRGAELLVEQGDATNREELSRALERAASADAPLRGVVHAAGLVEDALLSSLDDASVARVLAPKVEGTLALHELTRALPLDFFVLFSSAVSLWGSPGQASYAAANSFVDAFVEQRRAEGLTATSINWGPWSDVGMFARLGARERETLARRGMGTISPAEGRALFLRALALDLPQLAVLPLLHSPERIELDRASLPARMATGLAKERVPAIGADASQRERLRGKIRALLARTLRVANPEQVRTDVSFTDLGVDSLMALELREEIEALLASPIPPSELLAHPTVDALSARLDELIGSAQPGEPVQAAPRPVEAGPMQLDPPHGSRSARSYGGTSQQHLTQNPLDSTDSVAWDLTTDAPALHAHVARAAPWVLQRLRLMRESLPVPPTNNTFDTGDYFRPEGHFRAFYQRGPGAEVIAIKGADIRCPDQIGFLQILQQRTGDRNNAYSVTNGLEYFLIQERKIPGAVTLPEALSEAEKAAALQTAFVEQYGELGKFPIPLMVRRWPQSAIDEFVARIVPLLSGFPLAGC